LNIKGDFGCACGKPLATAGFWILEFGSRCGSSNSIS